MSVLPLHHVADGPADAPVLVLSGSLGSTLEMWSPQLPALTDRFRVIRVDHRGHGGSPTPPGPYRIADLGGDVLALLDGLGVRQVAWCGLSLGGMVGMWLASEVPERISRLALCCTSARYPDPSGWRDRIAAVRAGGTASIADAVTARWFTEGFARRHPDVVDAARRMISETPDEGYVGCCEAIAAWDHVARLPGIVAPTMVIAGTHDTSAPVRPHTSTITDGIRGATVHLVDGAHLATVERAEEINQLLREHLG